MGHVSMEPIRIVAFDGTGQPRTDGVSDGDVLLLVQGDEVSVVRLELLPPERFGPSLDHAINEVELAVEARQIVLEQHPALLESDRHWTLECPPNVAERAIFQALS